MIRIPLFQAFTLQSSCLTVNGHIDRINIFGPWETLALQPQATAVKSIKIILVAFSQKSLDH